MSNISGGSASAYIHRIYDTIVVTQDGRVGVSTTPAPAESFAVGGTTTVQDFTAKGATTVQDFTASSITQYSGSG
jgi:hypothetical protein